MKKHFRRYVSCLGVTLLLNGCGGGSGEGSSNGTVNVPIPQPSLSQTLDSYLKTHFNAGDAGISVLLSESGKIKYQGTIGMADKNRALSINGDTSFRLASVSKPITATAVMQLIEAGKLQLESSILKFLPELPKNWQAIQIKHLLSHRSGIPNFFSDAYINKFGGINWLKYLDNKKLIGHFSQEPELDFAAGSQAQYSNTNYVFLAEIVSRVSNMQFSEYMHKFIFEPAGLTHSYVINNTSEHLSGEALNHATTHLMYGVHLYFNGSSGQVSSAKDINAFAKALMTGKLITESSFRLMTQSHSSLFGTGYGYGWAVAEYENTKGQYFFHRGSNDSFKTYLAIDPSRELSLVILSNADDKGELHAQEIFKQVTGYLKL